MPNRIAVTITIAILTAGCASNAEKIGPSIEYEDATVKTASYRCPSGYVLQCETKRVGRIRFNSIGTQNLESCSCGVNNMPSTQSPLPGIY
jgi:hypothetical protein